MSSKIVCLDTNVLCYVFKTCRDEHQSKIEQAEALISQLKRDKSTIIIPSIVLAESAVHLEDQVASEYFSDISRYYMVAPFDTLAAVYYRSILRQKKSELTVSRKDYKRYDMSADVKIVATALSCGAKAIYSEDNGVGSIAEGFIDVYKLPPLPPKIGSLFDSKVVL